MSELCIPQVAIIDYGMGNLFSVKHACENANLNAHITSLKDDIVLADAIILPGVGAFGDAVEALDKLDLTDMLHKRALSGIPFMGICLGMQLMMSESHEFGRYRGLDIIKGTVKSFLPTKKSDRSILKVPHVGWNRIYAVEKEISVNPWQCSMLAGLESGEYMYFIHSFYGVPEDDKVILSKTNYGGIEFCSSFQLGNIFACQFHPERSGQDGLKIYKNLASLINGQCKKEG